MRETAKTWPRAALVVGALLMVGVVGVVGAMYVQRTPRRLVVKPYLMMLVARDGATPFLRDSAYVVQVGATRNGAHPIRISAWSQESSVMLSERQIRGAIEGVVAARREARLQPAVGMSAAAGGSATAGGTPLVTIELEVWAEGGFDASVLLHCVWTDRENGRRWPVQLPVMATRGRVTEDEALTSMLTRLLGAAATARCPDTRMRQGAVVAEPGGETATSTPPPALELPALATSTLSSPDAPAVRVELPVMRSSPEAPAVAMAPAVPRAPVSAAERARRDSVALARVGMANVRVVALAISVDSIHLRVGEAVWPERVLHLTGVAADGSEVPRLIPHYMIDNQRVAAFGADGLRGIAPGVTRVVVRAMGGNLATLRSTGASVSFTVKVEP